MTTLVDPRPKFRDRVAVVASGPTATAGAGAALRPTDHARAQVLSSVPANRFASPEEIAESAVYVTGEVLVVDGAQWLGKSIYTDPEKSA